MARPDTRMRMTITLTDYRRLPAEDRNDPGVLWHILIDDKGPDVQRDYSTVGGTTYQGWEYGE